MSDGILGIGVCTLDVLLVVDTLPGEEGVEMAQRAQLMGGGPVATALVAAASLGSRTTMLDRLGADDWRSAHILREFEQFGVDASRIALEEGAEASLASAFVRASDGARAIRFVPSTTAAIAPSDLDRDHLLSFRFVHCNGRHPDASLAAAKLCRESCGATRLSFDGGAGRYREAVLPSLEAADIAIVAAEFAEKASGETDPCRAGAGLAKLCPNADLIGITAGERGSWLFPRGDEPFHQPAFPVTEVVDTTGCGDVYHGAFLHALDSGRDYREAARIASAAGALNATALGGRGGLPNREKIEQVLAQNPA